VNEGNEWEKVAASVIAGYLEQKRKPIPRPNKIVSIKQIKAVSNGE
jgi:hypothetical protein